VHLCVVLADEALRFFGIAGSLEVASGFAAPVLLDLVHAYIGLDAQAVGVLRVFRIDRNSDAGADFNGFAGEFNGF